MPEEYKGWKLIKEYEYYGLYTNGIWRECFSRFDVGMIEKRRIAEVKLFNMTVGDIKWFGS